MKTKQNRAILWAVLAAVLYAFSSPFAKMLLNHIPPTMLAGLLYLGAGAGMSIVGALRIKAGKTAKENTLAGKDMPYTIGMVILDILAPIFLLIGLSLTTPANVSLLNNFEIVATSLIALFIFKETIHKRLWIAIGLISVSSMILSIDAAGSLSFSWGSLFVLLASVCWGLENNCTRMLSVKNPLQVVIIKGFGSGLGSLAISFILHETAAGFMYILAALLLGFVAYGLSIFLYVYAQRQLGAAKTSAYYAIAPFVGVGLSFIMYYQIPTISFVIALSVMILGTYFASTDRKGNTDSGSTFPQHQQSC